mmetsp:Transcript_6122/g.11226  ORF Transcript_6122/g.11226 Transcript_6122/m.11226 type:complete len:122 (+) Transcript_6122:954-1319(+)
MYPLYLSPFLSFVTLTDGGGARFTSPAPFFFLAMGAAVASSCVRLSRPSCLVLRPLDGAETAGLPIKVAENGKRTKRHVTLSRWGATCIPRLSRLLHRWGTDNCNISLYPGLRHTEESFLT